MLIESGQKFLLTGDSVTDCGRAHPVGEGNGALGDGYVRAVHALLDSRYPERHIRVLNTGISGNTSRDLLARYDTDVLQHQPGWVSVMIGINDIWRQFDQPLKTETHVLLEEYVENVSVMIEKTQPYADGLLLVSPCYMEQNLEDPMRRMTGAYQAVLRELAQRYGVLYVDAQKEMDRYFAAYPPESMAWDRVHPNHVGHMLIARAIVNALEFAWAL